MSDQDDFLSALGVTIDGLPIDRAGLAAATALGQRIPNPPPNPTPNPPGTNNYFFPPNMRVTDPSTMTAQQVAFQQATFDNRALNDFANIGEHDQETEQRITDMLPRRAERGEDYETDEEELGEDEWRRRQTPHMLLMGEEELEDYGEWEGESEGSGSTADSVEGYSDPEKILCQSDQEFPRRGHLFLVKWKGCSVLRSSWEWESDSFETVMDDRPQWHNFLKPPHPIRVEWEERKERIGSGEEERFDAAKWNHDVSEERKIKASLRVLRRWRRKLVGIQRVLETQRMEEEADFRGEWIKRSDKEDREDKIRAEAEKRKLELERKSDREDEDEEMMNVSAERVA